MNSQFLALDVCQFFFFIELVIDNSEVEKDNGGKLS